MIRRAFTMRLKPGAFPQYERHHKNVWPELVREIEKSGIASMSIFRTGDRLFVMSEVTDAKSWERLWKSEIHAKWGEVMDPLLFINPDGMIDAGELEEVYHLSTNAGKKAPTPTLPSSSVSLRAKGRNTGGGGKQAKARGSSSTTKKPSPKKSNPKKSNGR